MPFLHPGIARIARFTAIVLTGIAFGLRFRQEAFNLIPKRREIEIVPQIFFRQSQLDRLKQE